MKYKNSKGLVALIYFATIFFPLMSLACGYFAYNGYIAGKANGMVILCTGFLFFGYLTLLSIKLARFARLEYTLTDEYIEVSGGENSEKHIWEKGMKIKNSTYFQLFWLYSSDGRVIVMVDYTMPGFEDFSDFIYQKVQA